MTQAEPEGFSFRDVAETNMATPSSLTSPLSEQPTIHVNGSDWAAAPGVIEDEPVFTSDSDLHLDSAASMATEILSVAPETVITEAPPGPESELISQDMTLIARGRKKRFRLR
jgi:hypothetical protein